MFQKREVNTMENNTRIIDTGIKTTKKTSEIFRAVIGQMSDGIWENASSMNGYWSCCNICDEHDTIEIHVSTSYYSEHLGCINRWRWMTDAEVLKFFANRIKQIALIELEDRYNEETRKQIMGQEFLHYRIPEGKREEYEAKQREYEKYIQEHQFVKAGKFTHDDTCLLIYLNYREDVTLSDAVDARQGLLNKIKAA